MTLNRIMVFAGITTLLQATVQLILTSFALAQHFCIIDFLRGFPLLLYIRILYFHNPDGCGIRINIGQSIDSIADQAFVLLTQESFTAFRTFIINCISLGLSVFWIFASVIIITGGARNKQSKGRRWPWIITTVAVCGLDLVATVTYANDSFHTRTLNDVMDFIGGIASGTANVQLNTSWAAWLMVLFYSKFVVFFIMNVFLIILIIVECNIKRDEEVSIERVEAPTTSAPLPAVVDTPKPVVTANTQSPEKEVTPVSIQTQTTAVESSTPTPAAVVEEASDRDEEVGSLPSESRTTSRIPRAEFRRSFRRMKAFLFKKSPTPEDRTRSNPESVEASPERSPAMQLVDIDKKRTVNFPESLMSLPQRLENIIAEQRRRLDKEIIDTSGRRSPPRVSQSMPQLTTTSQPDGPRGRRGTTVELQSQLPWAYIPAPAHRMRDQLPPDEDLPPVPLPDYTAFPSVRKASVHRAASSLSSLTQKKDYGRTHSTRQTLKQADVLY